MTPTLLDLRGEQHPSLFPPKRLRDGSSQATSKTSRGKTVVRDPATIDGIVLHQTACVFGPAADRSKAHRRALGIPAHAVAFRDGVFAAPAPLTWWLYHGNGLNGHTLGLEVEGCYPGLVGKPSTLWGGTETPLDEVTIATARAALAWLVVQGRALGMPLRYVYAHRQSNIGKPSDPGEGLWRALAVEYAVPVLGMETRTRYTDGGRAVPRQWDPTGVGDY